jgi:hypothetical protein
MARSSDRNMVPISTTLIEGKNVRGKPVASGKIKPAILTAPPQRGRPTDYTPEMADLVCQRVLAHGTLLEACERHPELPSSTTVYVWLFAHAEFREKYARTRDYVMEMWADEIVQTANDESLEPNDRRVKIDTKKWLMSKVAYRRYGDKLIHSGDPENPIQVMHRAARIADLSPVELEALDLFTRARLTVIDVEDETEGK